MPKYHHQVPRTARRQHGAILIESLIALAILLDQRRLGMALLCAIFALVNAVLLWGFFRWSLLV